MINIQKLLAFLYTNNNLRQKLMEKLNYDNIKNKAFWNNVNQGGERLLY